MPSDKPAPAGRKVRVLLIALVVLAAAGFGAWHYVDQALPYWHFRTVEAGAFYRSSQLDEADLGEAIARYGIRTVVNLRDVPERAQGGWYAAQQRAVAAGGAHLLDVPLPAGTPPTPEQIAEFLSVLDDPARRPVLVHCYHGTIRSAGLEGLFRCEYMGEDGPTALARVESWGRDLATDYPLISEFIRTYVPRRDRAVREGP